MILDGFCWQSIPGPGPLWALLALSFSQSLGLLGKFILFNI